MNELPKVPVTSQSVTRKSNQDFERYNDINCGNIRRASGFILNAERKQKIKRPWIAAMYVSLQYSCTVNFFSKSRAVTAAHCFADKPLANEINVRNRSFTLQCTIRKNKFLDIFVKEYKKHPNYQDIPKYDIAILDTDNRH